MISSLFSFSPNVAVFVLFMFCVFLQIAHDRQTTFILLLPRPARNQEAYTRGNTAAGRLTYFCEQFVVIYLYVVVVVVV